MSTARLWFHGLAAAAVGGAVTALTDVLLRPGDLQFDSGSLYHYATTAAGGALISVLAYFKQSPLQPLAATEPTPRGGLNPPAQLP